MDTLVYGLLTKEIKETIGASYVSSISSSDTNNVYLDVTYKKEDASTDTVRLTFLKPINGVNGINGVDGEDGLSIVSASFVGNDMVFTRSDSSTLVIVGVKTLLTPNIESKQDTLVSGTSIKTINGQSVLGNGNIVITGGDSLTNYYDKTQTETLLSNKVDKVVGKGLSTNDFTDTFKQAYDGHLANTSNPHNTTASQVGAYTTAEVDTIANTKVDKVSGSSLVQDTKVTGYDNHLANTLNPHSVTKAQIGLSNVDNTSDANKPVSTAQQTALNTKANSSEVYTKSQIDTLTLDFYTEAEINQFLEDYSTTSETATLLQGKADLENGKVKLSQLPDSVLGQVEYKGTWNASTNTPDLTTVLPSGKYYITSVAGTFQSVAFEVGDWILSNGTTWDKVDNTDAVSSVNGLTGNVVITKSTISLGNVDNTSDASKPISTATQTALNNKANKATTLSGYGITDAISSTTSQTSKYVLIAPNGTNGAPTFRALVESDLPTLAISKISGLQTALDGKVDDSQVLTNVPTGALFTDTVYTHPTTDGNKHLPSGGASGQYVKWSSAGTGAWSSLSGVDIVWATSATAGKFDTSTTTPTSANRLNYNGYLYPTGLNLVGMGDTATAATHYFCENATDGFIRPKTLANVQAELVTFASVYNAYKTWFTSGVGTAGINGATNYALFPDAQDTLTLGVGTYEIEIVAYVTVATSVVSATFQLSPRGAGTAVGTVYGIGIGAITNAGASTQTGFGPVALGTAMTLTVASAVAGRAYSAQFKGIMNITTAGTIIPAYQFSATLTSGVVTLNALNHMKIKQITASAVTTAGGWA